MKVKRIGFLLTLFCLIGTLITGVCVSVSAEDSKAYRSDVLIFGSDTAHNVQADSQSIVRSLTTVRAGEYENEKYIVRRLAAKSGKVSFDMAVSGGNVVLEFEEVHNKNKASYGYYINVDGTDIFLRVGAESSVGPQHYFARVPAELTNGKNKIRVTLRNVSDSSVSLTRVWAHSNLDTLRNDEGIDSRMPVMILNGDFFNLNWTAHKATKERFREQLQSYIDVFGNESKYKNFKPGFVIEVTYLLWPDEQVYRTIDMIIELSRELDVPMAINFNSWWGGNPTYVPDGEGGFFSDIKYQMSVYAPNNINGRGIYQTTTPNVWGNNPWLSMNDEHLNSVRLSKYRQFCKYMSQKLAESRIIAGEKGIPEFSVFIENEPQYWTEFLFTRSEVREVCDTSQKFVEALKKNYGVDFDPTDWLDKEEQEALFYNLNDYAADIMDAAAEGAATDYIVVNGDQLTLPEYQLMDNFYTHQFDTNIEMRVVSEWDTFETGITKNGHPGMEGYGLWGNVANRNMGAHTAARGKFAAVNIECGGDGSAINPLKYYYAAGADYGVLYNTQKSAQPSLAAMDETINTEEYDEPFEGREIFCYETDENTTFEPSDILVSADGMGISPMHRHYAACPHDDDHEGTLTFRVDNKGKPFENGLAVMLYGMCWSHMDSNCRVDVFAGPDLEHMTQAAFPEGRTLDVGGVPIDITDNIDKTKSVAYFTVQLRSGGDPTFCHVFKVRALEKFGEKLGNTTGSNFTLVETRLNNLIVTYRADVEKMLAEQKAYCGSHPDYIEAERLYNEGRYKSAKQLLLGTASLKMPAKFMVIDSGKLGDYPITAEVADKETPVSIILREIGDTVRFEIGAEKDTDVTLHFADKKGRYELKHEGDEFILSKSGNGEYIESDGTVTFTLTAGRPTKEYPKQFTGFSGYQPWQTTDEFMVSFHNIELGNHSRGTFFKLADDAKIYRGPVEAKCGELEEYPREKLPEVPFGERVDVTLNDKGEISKLEIRYGLVKGTITKFTEAKLPEMVSPYMEVTEDGTGKKWLFKLDSQTEFDSSKTGGAASFVAAAPGKGIGFKEGNIVCVSYIPLKAGNEEEYYASKIYEEYTTMMSDQLNDDSYRTSIYSENNVTIAPLDGNNLDIVGLAATGSTGSVVWKIESDKPIKEVMVKYSGRAIMGSTVEILAGANGYIYDKISDLKDIFFHNVNQEFTCYTDDPKIVGGNTVYIKANFKVQANTTWGFLNSIQIDIKD